MRYCIGRTRTMRCWSGPRTRRAIRRRCTTSSREPLEIHRPVTTPGDPLVRLDVRCVSCGEENPPRARFCLACAAALPPTEATHESRRVVTVLFADLVGSTDHRGTARCRSLPRCRAGRLLRQRFGRSSSATAERSRSSSATRSWRCSACRCSMRMILLRAVRAAADLAPRPRRDESTWRPGTASASSCKSASTPARSLLPMPVSASQWVSRATPSTPRLGWRGPPHNPGRF